MVLKTSHPTRWAWFSPWMLVGSVCILAGILLVLAVKNVHREREFTESALLSQATVLMRSLEASSRTGMMGMGWGRRQLQVLMEETAQQPDIEYVALVNSTGTVFAHSDSTQVGGVMPIAVPSSGQTMHRFTQDARSGRESFEVARSYQPWFGQHGRRAREGCVVWGTEGQEPDLFLVVGLDPKPFEDASNQDLHQTLLLFGIMLLVGAAGFVSLVWAQHYRSARRSLQEIRAFTSTIVNQMPVGLIVTDPNGRIQNTNEASRQILSSSGGLSGRVEDFPCFSPIAGRLRKGETVLEEEVFFRCPVPGAPGVPLLVNAAALRDEARAITGYVFLFTDMTGIKQLEEQLHRSERLAALGRLAAGIAHEIRNPLSSIKGFATILGNRFKEDDQGRKIAEVMVQEVERLNRVITELLDFARPTELHKKLCSCRDLIGHSLRLIESDALRQGVRVEALIEPETLQADVDPDRFAQILLNLYLNALQAMEQGGRLTIEAGEQAGQVSIGVADSGTGIAPEHLAHIFDPYFTTKPGGVGLGLANVHKLVEAHGGDVEVVSSPGKGTRLTIRVPSVEPSQGSPRIGRGSEANRCAAAGSLP